MHTQVPHVLLDLSVSARAANRGSGIGAGRGGVPGDIDEGKSLEPGGDNTNMGMLSHNDMKKCNYSWSCARRANANLVVLEITVAPVQLQRIVADVEACVSGGQLGHGAQGRRASTQERVSNV